MYHEQLMERRTANADIKSTIVQASSETEALRKVMDGYVKARTRDSELWKEEVEGSGVKYTFNFGLCGKETISVDYTKGEIEHISHLSLPSDHHRGLSSSSRFKHSKMIYRAIKKTKNEFEVITATAIEESSNY